MNPRKNPRIEQLEKEVAVLRLWLDSYRKDPGDCPFLACDNSCVVARPTGMATNGGCRCDEVRLRQAVQWWRRRAIFLQLTIQDMRDGCTCGTGSCYLHAIGAGLP